MAHIIISRQEFLRRAALGSLALPFFLDQACDGAPSPTSPTPASGGSSSLCTTTPAVPEGPFYKDEQLNRSDITGGKDGVRITYEFVVQDSRCQPVPGAIVDLW
jgi:hypothetical protein